MSYEEEIYKLKECNKNTW